MVKFVPPATTAIDVPACRIGFEQSHSASLRSAIRRVIMSRSRNLDGTRGLCWRPGIRWSHICECTAQAHRRGGKCMIANQVQGRCDIPLRHRLVVCRVWSRPHPTATERTKPDQTPTAPNEIRKPRRRPRPVPTPWDFSLANVGTATKANMNCETRLARKISSNRQEPSARIATKEHRAPHGR